MAPDLSHFNLMRCACGKRRGLHRYGTEQCPNPNWKPGNGQPDFLAGWVFTPALGDDDHDRRERAAGAARATSVD